MCEHFDKDYDDDYEEDENLDDDCEMEKRKLYDEEDDDIIFFFETEQLFMEIFSGYTAVLYQIVPLDNLNVLQCTAAGQWIAGMCVPMKADLAHRLTDLTAAEDCRAWHVPAGQPFSRHQDIRGHIFILTGKHCSRLSDSCNNLVKDQKRTKFVTQFPHTLPESRWGNNHSTGSKDRF